MEVPLRALVLLSLLVACGSKGDDSADAGACFAEVPVVDMSDAKAGYQVLDTTHETAWTGTREVPVHLWYPTDATEGTGAVFQGIAALNDPESLVDAPYAAPEGCKHPLVAYSHGSVAWAGSGSTLLRQFVRNGWVAVAPDHTGNTLTTDEDPRPVGFSMTRVSDVLHAIDTVENLPSDHPLAGRVDTSRVVVIGHSFGGQTAWLMSGPDFHAAGIDEKCAASSLGCTEAEKAAFARVDDARIVGVVPMAGSAGTDLVTDEGWAAMRTPVFYMTGSADNDGTEPYARAEDDGDVTWVELEGACHESFTAVTRDCDTMEKDDSLPVVATYATAFAARTVLESADDQVLGILDGSVEVADFVTLEASP